MVGFSLLLFPKLALGLSRFETGVAVMPLVRGDAGGTEDHPEGRIRNTKKLLTTAASIMSVMLVGSSIVTTMMVPADQFKEGGKAYGRALAYVAHEHLGPVFGTVSDISTVTSLVSRVMRSTELRVHGVEADDAARAFLREAAGAPVRIIANRPDTGLPSEYEGKLREARESHHLPPDERVLFVEVRPRDASEFSERLRVSGIDVEGHHVLRCTSPAIPNAIAALLLFGRDQTGKIPHAYFGWTEGNPITYLLKFLAFGGRHRAGHPRGPPAGGAEPDAAEADPRGMTRVLRS